MFISFHQSLRLITLSMIVHKTTQLHHKITERKVFFNANTIAFAKFPTKIIWRNHNMLNMPYNRGPCYYTEKIPKLLIMLKVLSIEFIYILKQCWFMFASYLFYTTEGSAMLNNITFYNIITLFVNTLMRTLCPTLVYAKACR